MSQQGGFWQRYWSLAIALGLPLLVFLFLDLDWPRAITAIVCIILVAHSWIVQRRYTQGRLRLLFWTLVLLLPMLGAIWLGLNVIRVYTYNYAADYSLHLGDFRQDLHWYVVKTQNGIMWVSKADLLFIPLWAVVCILKRKARGSITAESTGIDD